MAGSATTPARGIEAQAARGSGGTVAEGPASSGRLDQTLRLIAGLLAVGCVRLRVQQVTAPARVPTPETPPNRVDSAPEQSVNVVETGAPGGPRAS